MSYDPPIRMQYTNYRGETSIRTIIPLSVFYGSTEYHEEPGWLLKAYDHDKGAYRDFALKDASFILPQETVSDKPRIIWTRQTSGWGNLERGEYQNRPHPGCIPYICLEDVLSPEEHIYNKVQEEIDERTSNGCKVYFGDVLEAYMKAIKEIWKAL